jgi:hypothetical protein
MGLREFQELLERLGLGRVPASQIHYCVSAGHIERPKLSPSLSFVFEPKHARQFEAWAKKLPKRGPKPQAPETAVAS